jgi:DUF2075 family protein
MKIRNGRIVTNASARSKNDSSVKGIKRMMDEDPERAGREADMIIKNTYRTLMTRGMKGCYVWSVDEETNDMLRELASRSETS